MLKFALSSPLMATNCKISKDERVSISGFPSFLPREVERIRDPAARKMAKRIERLPVQTRILEKSIMSSCVKPLILSEKKPVVLLHGFDSSCLEWRYTYPLLENAGLETWAVDVLGWGFSDLDELPPCNVASKREHLYQFWRSYIKKSMILVGPSLGAAVAIDFAANHPETDCVGSIDGTLILSWVHVKDHVYFESRKGFLSQNIMATVLIDMEFQFISVSFKGAVMDAKVLPVILLNGVYIVCKFHRVSKLVLIDASVYANGTGNLTKLPRILAYAGVSLLKSVPLRMCAKFLAFSKASLASRSDCTSVGRLHCLLPWWEDATLDFMLSGGYDVTAQIKELKQKTLIIWGEDDQIISNKFAWRLHDELPNSVLRQISDCGHLPHVEKPRSVADLIVEFVQGNQN